MKTRIGFIALLLALLGAPLYAQRGGGGGSRGGGGDRELKTSSAPDIPSGNDIDKMDPVAMLVGSQRDLELSAETIGKLSLIDSDLMRNTRQPLKVIDSLHAVLRAAAESPDSRGAIRETMAFYNKAVSDVRTQHDDASKKAIELLTGDARKKAEEMIKRRREEFDNVTKTRRPG